MKHNVTIRNDFHHTSCVVRCQVLLHHPTEATIRPTKSQLKRSKRLLCGIVGCTCSNDAGARGPQTYNGKRLIVDMSAIFPG